MPRQKTHLFVLTFTVSDSLAVSAVVKTMDDSTKQKNNKNMVMHTNQ